MAKKPVDLAKAAEHLSEAQEGVKLTHTAMQACTKAWDGIRGPSAAKREMWRATVAAREGFLAAISIEQQCFGVMKTIVGQGELFNDGAADDEGDAEPASTSTAIAPIKPRGGRGASPQH